MPLLICLFSAHLCAGEITANWITGTGDWSNSSLWACGGCTYPNNGGGNIFDVLTSIASLPRTLPLGSNVGTANINSLVLGVPTPSLTSQLTVSNATLNVLGNAGTTVNVAGFLNLGSNGYVNTPTVNNSGNLLIDSVGQFRVGLDSHDGQSD